MQQPDHLHRKDNWVQLAIRHPVILLVVIITGVVGFLISVGIGIGIVKIPQWSKDSEEIRKQLTTVQEQTEGLRRELEQERSKAQVLESENKQLRVAPDIADQRPDRRPQGTTEGTPGMKPGPQPKTKKTPVSGDQLSGGATPATPSSKLDADRSAVTAGATPSLPATAAATPSPPATAATIPAPPATAATIPRPPDTAPSPPPSETAPTAAPAASAEKTKTVECFEDGSLRVTVQDLKTTRTGDVTVHLRVENESGRRLAIATPVASAGCDASLHDDVDGEYTPGRCNIPANQAVNLQDLLPWMLTDGMSIMPKKTGFVTLPFTSGSDGPTAASPSTYTVSVALYIAADSDEDSSAIGPYQVNAVCSNISRKGFH